jgi:hypothetical protein
MPGQGLCLGPFLLLQQVVISVPVTSDKFSNGAKNKESKLTWSRMRLLEKMTSVLKVMGRKSSGVSFNWEFFNCKLVRAKGFEKELQWKWRAAQSSSVCFHFVFSYCFCICYKFLCKEMRKSCITHS